MVIKKLTVSDIERMNYTDFIALLQETNRCPGGKQTIRRIQELLHIDSHTTILDVGSNTGFTSLEFARITPAHVSGIDISESCTDEAKKLLSQDSEDVRSRVTFQVADAYSIPFPDEAFDLVMVGGATSFMDNKNKAINEYLRILRHWGFLVMTPLTYHTQPPLHVVNNVSKIIGVTIKPMSKEDWIKIVSEATEDFELYFDEPHKLFSRTDGEIKEYVEYFIHKNHIEELSSDVKESIRKKWLNILKVFNENHKYLGYSIIIFRKRLLVEEPELFAN